MVLVATNGCFDILHAAHVDYLEKARALGSHLIIGLNSDRSVAQLKGAGRPVNTFKNRRLVLLGLSSVDDVFEVDSLNMVDFLLKYKPHVWAKGGDYTVDKLNASEVMAAKRIGARVHIIPKAYDLSTTKILKRAAKVV